MARVRVIGYGLLGLPLAFAALPVYVHVPHLYADTTGMNLALLGAILLGTRLCDACIDPWLGWLADRLPRRRMLALALLPFGLGFVALLNPPAAYPASWLVASLALTYLGFSAASVAYQAWGASLGDDSSMRTRLSASREGFGLLGVVLAAALPAYLASDVSVGTARLAWILPPLLLLAAVVTLAEAEGVGRSPLPTERLSDSLARAIGDAAFVRLLSVVVANGIAGALPATLFLFFVTDVLGLVASNGILLALYFVAGAVSLPFWVRLAARLGRVRAWMLSMLLAMVAFAFAGLLGQGDLLPFSAICLASGLALGADLALPAAIAADLGERQGQSGACFGIWNLIAKLNLALSAGLALPLLDLLGYRPGTGQGLSALSGMYALLPLAFKLLAATLLWRWRHSLEIRS
ncbi:MAG: MFS transporter [Betaproteobacteria bacterium]|nr:MFS transporter [Betaproteobacteria bacterium]